MSYLMPRMLMMLSYYLECHFLDSVHRDASLTHTEVAGTASLFFNIYLIGVSVFRKMAGRFNWLYYHQ